MTLKTRIFDVPSSEQTTTKQKAKWFNICGVWKHGALWHPHSFGLLDYSKTAISSAGWSCDANKWNSVSSASCSTMGSDAVEHVHCQQQRPKCNAARGPVTSSGPLHGTKHTNWIHNMFVRKITALDFVLYAVAPTAIMAFEAIHNERAACPSERVTYTQRVSFLKSKSSAIYSRSFCTTGYKLQRETVAERYFLTAVAILTFAYSISPSTRRFSVNRLKSAADNR